MANITYKFETDDVKVFGLQPDTEAICFVEKNLNSRTELEALFQQITNGDKITVPTLSHLGSTMTELIASIHNLVLEKIELVVINQNDKRSIEQAGGLEGFMTQLQFFMELQYKVLNHRRQNGIAVAKAKDKLINEPSQKTYRGRQGASIAFKLGVIADWLCGIKISELAATHSVSRGSIYNYKAEIFQKYPSEIATVQHIHANSGVYEKFMKTGSNDEFNLTFQLEQWPKDSNCQIDLSILKQLLKWKASLDTTLLLK